MLTQDTPLVSIVTPVISLLLTNKQGGRFSKIIKGLSVCKAISFKYGTESDKYHLSQYCFVKTSFKIQTRNVFDDNYFIGLLLNKSLNRRNFGGRFSETNRR